MNDEMREITVLYARLSKDDGKKSGDSDSIVNQKMLLENFAKSEHLENCVFFADDGISGTTFNRPAFERAMMLVKSGRVKNFVVKDQSRLGRDYLTVGMLMEVVFPDNDVRFVAINDGYDSQKEVDNQMAPIRNLFNEFYARDTSKKIKSVKHAKGNAGEPIGGSLPYGYLKGPNYKQTKIWLVDEEAAKIVQRIFRECIEGKSLLAIADGLTADKILNPANHKVEIGEHIALVGKIPYLWSFDAVRRILANMCYLGAVVNFKTYKKSYKSKKCLPNPRENWKVAYGHHEPIIDREMFDLVQKLRETTKPRQTHNKKNGLFSGLIFCADCGHKHYYMTREKYAAYFCSGRSSRIQYCESYHRILERNLMKLVSDDFSKLQAEVSDETGDFVRQLCEKFESEDSDKVAKQERKIRENDARIEKIDDVIMQLYEDNLSGKFSADRFAKMSEKFEVEQRELKAKNMELREKFAKSDVVNQNVNKFLSLAKKAAALDNLTADHVRQLLERIEISEKTVNEKGEKIQKVALTYRFVGMIHKEGYIK